MNSLTPLEKDAITCASELTLAICHRLRDGAARMTKQEFRNALNRSIGSTADYADGCWIPFQKNPAAYLASRNPNSQSLELIRVILEITKDNK